MGRDERYRATMRDPLADPGRKQRERERIGADARYTDVRCSNAERAILECAIGADHPCDGEGGCDISAALAHGYQEVAAHLLMGATECPETERACSAPCDCAEPDIRMDAHGEMTLCAGCAHYTTGEGIDIYGARPDGTPHPFPRGWGDWTAWHAQQAMACPGCGSYSYPDADTSDYPEACPNCVFDLTPADVDEIAEGAARALFVSAWADAHPEEDPGGAGDWMDVAPDTPDAAYKRAAELLERIEERNGPGPWASLLARVDVAEQPEDLGHCLAMEALGHGVGWADNHPPHGLAIPDVENYDLVD